MPVRIQYEKIEDFGEHYPANNSGSTVTFKGTVRGIENDRQLVSLHYEAEIKMAEDELNKIIEESERKFKIIKADAIHRLGDLKPGEVSLLVEVKSEHREDGFLACMYIIDNIKKRVPIWKKSLFADGTEKWH